MPKVPKLLLQSVARANGLHFEKTPTPIGDSFNNFALIVSIIVAIFEPLSYFTTAHTMSLIVLRSIIILDFVKRQYCAIQIIFRPKDSNRCASKLWMKLLVQYRSVTILSGLTVNGTEMMRRRKYIVHPGCFYS